jgi:nitrite reductase/ring-hydroxylating ferredoxin subunit
LHNHEVNVTWTVGQAISMDAIIFYLQMNRGDFLKTGGILAACACGIYFMNGCNAITGNSDSPHLSKNTYSFSQGTLLPDLIKIPEFKRNGGSVKLEEPDRKLKIIVAKTGDHAFVALRDRCSHGGRELDYFRDQSIFRNVSFGHSRFDLEGNVMKGPAKNLLLKYNSILVDDEL